MAYRVLRRIPVADTGLVLTLSVQTGGLLDRVMSRSVDPRHGWDDVLRVVQRYYQQMGMELNELAAGFLEDSLKRPSVSTGRLAAAIRDERNIVVDRNKVMVGSDRWMTRAQVRYWRQIDRGTSVHLGQRLVGIWGSTWTGGYMSGGNWSIWSERWNARYPEIGGGYRRHGGGRGQHFIPASGVSDEQRRRMRGLLTPINRVRRSEARSTTYGSEAGTRIHRPIEAENYYAKALAEFRRRNRPINLLREAIAEVFGLPNTRGVPRSIGAIADFL